MSRGVPADLPHLGGAWRRAAPINGRAHYVNDSDMPAHIVWHLGKWFIVDKDIPNVLLYAVSDSPALHPNTILPGEWEALVEWPDTWRALPDFHLKTVKTDAPLSLDDLGRDYFVRVRGSRPVQFINPHTGEAAWSGAKPPGGVRYCHLCDVCISSNNFVTQHLRVKHPELVRVAQP